MELLEEIRTRRLFFDGGTGSLLQAKGLKAGEFPEIWNITHPDICRGIHVDYLREGADLFKTNTFGANGLKFKGEPCNGEGERPASSYGVEELVAAAMENARDALSAPGTSSGYSPTLTFLAEVRQSSLLLTVKDNGCGIAPENLSSVFEPFTTYKQGGTGLGLAIARRVVLAHQGTIQVSSRLGEGTIFTVTLPIQKDPA